MSLRSAHGLIGVVGLVLWLHLLMSLYPLPPEASREFLASMNQPIDPAVEREFWHKWFKDFALLVAGTTASCFAIWNLRFWKVAVFAMSACVALPTEFAVGNHVLERGGLSQWWQLWEAVAQRFIEKGEGELFAIRVYQLLVWPALHVALMLAIVCLWVLQLRVKCAHT